MPADYVKLAEAPVWVMQYPQCSACAVDLSTDGDGWVCENCGTSWDMDANDGDKGMLYEEWSGESLDGDPISEHQAWQIAAEKERVARKAFLDEILRKEAPDVR